MQKEFIPWRLHSYFWVWWCVMRPIHTSGSIRPQEKLHKEIGGLEGWRKAYVVSIQSVSCIVRLYWELDGLWAEALCNLNIFPLVWYYRDQGFYLRLSPEYSCVFMCDCFSSYVICVLFDIAQNQLSFCKFFVEVDFVFFFSIFHNLLIYSGNFYMVSEPGYQREE